MVAGKRIIVAAVLVVVLGAMIYGTLIRGGDVPGEEAAGGTSRQEQPASPAGDIPQPTDGSGPGTESQSSIEIKAAVQGFISMYTSQSWTNEGATDWVGRVLPYTTKSYGTQLQKSFSTTGSGAAWDEIQSLRLSRHGHINRLEMTGIRDISKGEALVLADYTVTTSPVQGTPHGSEAFARMVSLRKVNGEWLIDGFDNLTPDTSAPTGATPVSSFIPPTVGP